ncbi:MAG: hypothetical protein D8M59_14535 [Planctomycetes bacterium]|nr:hypothetical protein [Planctomycetota bacterium]NOG53326.1 hypothetical protein [Planctomycetota bacterium]
MFESRSIAERIQAEGYIAGARKRLEQDQRPPATCIEDDLIRRERLIPISEVPDLIWMPRRRGKPLTRYTMYNWIKGGLEVYKAGQLATTAGALRRFMRQRAEDWRERQVG